MIESSLQQQDNDVYDNNCAVILKGEWSCTSSTTSYSYSAPTTAPSTTIPTLRTVLPPFNQFFSYPNYSLLPTTNTTNPGSRNILTSSTGKENVSLSMTYTTTKPFSQSTYYSQRSSTTGYCEYNSYVYPPHPQQLYQTASTNITLSSSTSYSYSSLITTTRPLPLTTIQTLCTVLPPFNQLFSSPNYTLPPTGDMTRMR